MRKPGFEADLEDDALREWRRRATDLVAGASVVVHIPILVPLVGGYGPVGAGPAKTVGWVGFLLIVACAVLRGIPQRIRVWTMLTAVYSLAIVGAAVLPEGPYVRVLPMIPPILAIGLLGVPEARICTLLSAGVLISAPFLHSVPGLSLLLGEGSVPSHVAPSQKWWPGAAMTAELVVLMVFLERFYGFLRQAASERAAAAVELEHEIDERRRLEVEIARVSDGERRRLGHEIHDGVCQQLTGALLRCHALEVRVRRGEPVSVADMDALSALLSETIQEARAVAQGLCPLDPSPDALAPALRALAERTQQTSGIACEFHAAGGPLVPDPNAAQHLYRIAQEGLSNAVRHARASLIRLHLRAEAGSLLLQVEDNGTGFTATAPSGGMGLRTMSFRAQILDGGLAVESVPGGGTRISCQMPRPRATPLQPSQSGVAEGTAP